VAKIRGVLDVVNPTTGYIDDDPTEVGANDAADE
jgi:hypothetical protein